jgi:hypothetical protein
LENYKLIADTLASLAAFVAIVSVLASWYRSIRKPLVIQRIIVHRKEDETTFILIIKNVKDYPVEIKKLEGYKRKKYTVQKKVGQKPEFSEGLPLSERLFFSKERFDISPSGNTDVQITVNGQCDVPHKLLLSFSTSHGYHECWCKDILSVPVGEVNLYRLDYKSNPKTKVGAKALYWWVVIKELTKSCSRGLRGA